MAKARKIHVEFDEVGESGTRIYSGYITGEEYKAELRGQEGIRTYDEMRRSDSTVAQALWAVKYPVVQADWFVKPASDDPKDKEIAEFVRVNLLEQMTFKHSVEEALTCVDFGYSIQEMVFAPKEIDGTLRIALTKLGFRKQLSILRWLMDNEQPGITQTKNDGTSASIPLDKLSIFSFRKEGDNHEGMSILRPAYKHWYYKDKFYKLDAIGNERQSVGVPFARYPVGASKEDKEDVRKLLRNMRANQEGHLMTPMGWESGFMDMGARSTKDIKPGIDHHDLQILKAVFAQFMALGQTSSGNRATSEDHSRFFELAEEALADLVAEVYNDTVVKTLVDLNFNVTAYPVLAHGKIGDENLPVISDAVSKFVTAGALNPRPEDENLVRQLLRWPELSEEEVADLKAKAEEAAKLPPPSVDNGTDSKAKDIKPEDADGNVNADAALAEARAVRATLSKVLYGNTGTAA